jgi:hypothetical protein
MIVFGLDPGTEQTAIVGYNGVSVTQHRIVPNETLLIEFADNHDAWFDPHKDFVLATEYMESSLGMAVGKETCRTIFWNGRFVQAWSPRRWAEVTRYNVKRHICGQVRATDANIRQALIDRFGGSKAIGLKKTPGPLFGIKSHEWAALAVAVTWYDLNGHLPEDVRPGVKPEF